MIEQLILSFVEYLRQLSYFGIVIALTFEFVPAEIVLPLAGYWVYQGDMTLVLTVLAGTIGGTTGPLTLYLIGRYGGRPFLLKYGKYLFIREKQVQLSDNFFQKYGGGVAFFGRFVPGVRTIISIPCGMAKMNVWVFCAYTFLAMLPITALYVWLGFKFGPRWKEVGPLAKDYLLEILVVIAIVVTLYIIINKAIKKYIFPKLLKK